MAETRRQFDPEFRAGAVRSVRETGKSIAQVARDLGIIDELPKCAVIVGCVWVWWCVMRGRFPRRRRR
ncbi:transposase, partial [Micromonospora sp. NPDC050980]|uniref:transposase n=1 Tax=Micromonospora sp. NPDC050980 TaxID=3155161 RepID=UPI0033C0B178